MTSIADARDDESFKFRALSAGAVMAFDGQTEHSSLLPSKFPMRRSPFFPNVRVTAKA